MTKCDFCRESTPKDGCRKNYPGQNDERKKLCEDAICRMEQALERLGTKGSAYYDKM